MILNWAALYKIQNLWGVSSDILCICVAQGTAKLLEVKLGVLLKDEKCVKKAVEKEDRDSRHLSYNQKKKIIKEFLWELFAYMH